MIQAVCDFPLLACKSPVLHPVFHQWVLKSHLAGLAVDVPSPWLQKLGGFNFSLTHPGNESLSLNGLRSKVLRPQSLIPSRHEAVPDQLRQHPAQNLEQFQGRPRSSPLQTLPGLKRSSGVFSRDFAIECAAPGYCPVMGGSRKLKHTPAPPS